MWSLNHYPQVFCSDGAEALSIMWKGSGRDMGAPRYDQRKTHGELIAVHLEKLRCGQEHRRML